MKEFLRGCRDKIKAFFAGMQARLKESPPGKGLGTSISAGWKRLVEHIKNHKKAAAIAAAVALVLTVAIVAVPGNTDKAAVQTSSGALVAERLRLDGDSYDTDGRVYMTGTTGLTKEDIEAGLTVEPEVPYRVVRINDDRYSIRLTRPEAITYTITYTEPQSGTVCAVEVGQNQPLTVQLVSTNTKSFGINDTIDLIFSDYILFDELEKYIRISPAIDYELYTEGEHVWIYPLAPLEYDTRYTVTIDQRMSNLDGSSFLGEPVSFTLTTQAQNFKVSLADPGSTMLRESDTLPLEVNTVLEGVSADFTVPMVVELYKFPSIEKYLSQVDNLINYDIDLSPMERSDVFVYHLVNKSNTFQLPNPGLGGYIMRITATHPNTGQEYQFRKAVCVTDYSIYAQTSGTQTLVWANSRVTGQPLSGYTIEFLPKANEQPVVSAVTDADGLALFTYNDESTQDYYRRSSRRIITVKDPQGTVIYADNTSVLNSYRAPMKDRYYSFFQTDRPLYKPTDEINFWGYVQPYSGNEGPRPTHARIVLGEDSINQWVDVEIGGDGTFQGVIPLEAVKSANYRLAFKLRTDELVPQEEPTQAEETTAAGAAAQTTQSSGEEGEEVEVLPEEEEPEPEYVYITLDSQYIQVKEYEKPAYVIEASVDKPYYLPRDQVTVTIQPTFYDGTPMPNFNLEFKVREGYYGDFNFVKNISTDGDGIATVSFPAFQGGETRANSWLPTTNRYTVQISEDGENIVYNGEYVYFPTDTMIAGEMEKQDNGNISISIETAKINLERVEEEEDMGNFGDIVPRWNSYDYSRTQFDYFRGDPSDVDVEITVNYNYYDEEGKYRSGTRTIETKTENGTVTVEDLVDKEFLEERYLYIYTTLRTKDSDGRVVAASQYWYNSYGHTTARQEATVPAGYNFQLLNQNGEDVLDQYSAYLSYNHATMKVGDSMNFYLRYQDRPMENNGRILWTILQEEIIDQGMTTSSSLHFTQSATNANSINLVAAYFDGQDVYPIRNTIISLDKSSIRLNVEVTTDKEVYEPGEQVNLRVRVTNQNGQGVAGTTCISIVDEAIYAMREHYINVMDDLYRDFYFSHYTVQKYSSMRGDFIHDYGGDSGKGNGANMQFLDKVRKNFKDTALFQLVRTDANGNGTYTFTLPDNVTEWRVTGVSIGDNLYAGQSQTSFITTMPFFIRPVVSSKYLDGDDIAMLVQGHGVVLGEDSEISYTVTITGDGVNETLTAENVAYQSSEINFGKLPQGEYTLLATAQSGQYRDTVEMPLYVINSNLELVISRGVDLQEPLDINAMRYPVVMTFYDKEHEAYYSSISSLLTHYCMEARQRMSRFTAKRALAQHMDPGSVPQHIRSGNDFASDMQNLDGGIGSYVGSKSDPMITAKVLIIAKDQFNLNSMADYFRKTLQTSQAKRDVSASYLGLAVIGEDVLEEILDLLEKSTTPMSQRIYLISALAYLDETERALELYAQHVTPYMTDDGNGRYFKANSIMGEGDEELTAAAWIASSKLGLEDSDAIAIYFAKYPWRYSTLFECMIYVTNYDKEVLASTLTYSVNGRTTLLDLGLRGQATVSFNKSEFDSLELVDVPENLAARAYFIGEPQEIDIQPTDKVSITKDIKDVGNGRYSVSITIDFADDAPTGYYDVSEWVPSNMRLYSVDKANRNTGERWYYSYTTEEQKIYFSINRTSNIERIVLNYTAQKTYDAEAVVDSTYIIHGDTGENNLTERTTIK